MVAEIQNYLILNGIFDVVKGLPVSKQACRSENKRLSNEI